MLRTSRPVLVSMLLTLSAGCAGDGVYAADERPAMPAPMEEPPAPTRLGALDCPGAGRGFSARLQLSGWTNPQLGECGALTWVDDNGDLFVLREEDEAPVRVASGTMRRRANRRRDAFLLSQDGQRWTLWQDGETGAPVMASQVGFVRDGETERAWACDGETLGLVEAEGLDARVDGVLECNRVVAASDAPVFVFVDSNLSLQVLDLRGPTLLDLSEVPYVAAADDRLRLTRDGTVLLHQRQAGGRVGVFDLTAPAGERLVGAPDLTHRIGAMMEAARAGHVMAMRTEDSVIVLGADRRLHDYPEGTLLALSPDGDAVLFSRPRGVGRLDMVMAEPGGRRTRIAETSHTLRALQSSVDGDSLLLMHFDPSQPGGDGFLVHRFGRLEVLQPTLDSAPSWLGSDGSLLDSHGRSGVRLLDAEGVPRRSFQQPPSMRELEPGRALALERVDDRSTLSVVDTRSGELRALLEASRVGAFETAGGRAMLVDWQQDPDDTTVLETVVYAGRP